MFLLYYDIVKVFKVKILNIIGKVVVAERLRRSTANAVLSECEGSNPFDDAYLFFKGLYRQLKNKYLQ